MRQRRGGETAHSLLDCCLPHRCHRCIQLRSGGCLEIKQGGFGENRRVPTGMHYE